MRRLTRATLDGLREDYRKGAMLFDSEEHQQWVVSITESAPQLFDMAEALLEVSEKAERIKNGKLHGAGQ